MSATPTSPVAGNPGMGDDDCVTFEDILGRITQSRAGPPELKPETTSPSKADTSPSPGRKARPRGAPTLTAAGRLTEVLGAQAPSPTSRLSYLRGGARLSLDPGSLKEEDQQRSGVEPWKPGRHARHNGPTCGPGSAFVFSPVPPLSATPQPGNKEAAPRTPRASRASRAMDLPEAPSAAPSRPTSTFPGCNSASPRRKSSSSRPTTFQLSGRLAAMAT